MQFILELLLLPIFELLFYGIGYVTGWLLVPVFTFGHVTVEPERNGKRLKPKLGRIQRTGPGKFVMEAELASCIGVVFWVLVFIGICLI